jgi:signal transduction histidine kinase
MDRLMSPAVVLMNRLKYPQKFLLISFVFAVPLIIVLSQYLVNVEYDIRFNSKEQVGLKYNTPLVDLLELIERHAAMSSAARSGATDFNENVQALQGDIAAQIEIVDAVDAQLGGVLNTTASWSAIKQNWQMLQSTIPSLGAADSIEQHIALTKQILALITESGNNSNLILDPDLDSYYLMNSVITTLPQTIEYFSQLRTYGMSAIASGVITPGDEARLTILMGLAQSALESNQRSYEYSYDNNPALEVQLSAASVNTQEGLNAFLDTLNTTFIESTPPGFLSAMSEAFFTQSSEAIENSFVLYRQVTDALDAVIQKRVDNFVAGRTFVVAVALLALAGTVYLFAAFYLSVKKTIAALDQASERIVNSNMAGDLVLESRDELAQAAVAFNNVAKRLDLARREAVEATRMKDLFLATMSHELRTPLNAMIGFLHLMIYSGQMDDDNVHMAQRSLANTQRLLTLINNILDLSRIATGGLEIVPGEISPRHVAAGLYNDLKLLAQEKGLRLELEVDPTLPETINQDETRISQIVVNLVGNAIKFTEQGTIDLEFKRLDERLVIQVSDTGVGIPQSKQHLIFDDFFQVDGTSTRSQQGAGLGLAIVKRLVLLMNGTINLVSTVGQGSTFTVEVPLNLPRYEPGDRRKQAEHVFVRSLSDSPVAQS